jgi:hypothetical protein
MLVHQIGDRVTVSDGESAYCDTITGFEADRGAAFPAFPEPPQGQDPYTVRFYSAGVRHFTSWGGFQCVEQPMPWADGDVILTSLNALLAAQAVRLAPPLGQQVTDAVATINGAAEAARERYITPGYGQVAVYLLKEGDARAYAAANYPSAQLANYPFVNAERLAMGSTGQAAADFIITTADAWRAKAAEIEQARRSGILAVQAAADAAAVAAARDAAVTALEGL